MKLTFENKLLIRLLTRLAGLTAAHLLESNIFTKEDGSKLKLSAHLFEKSKSIGMDSSSISVTTSSNSFRLDTPMRAINAGTHSRVSKLYVSHSTLLSEIEN